VLVREPAGQDQGDADLRHEVEQPHDHRVLKRQPVKAAGLVRRKKRLEIFKADAGRMEYLLRQP